MLTWAPNKGEFRTHTWPSWFPPNAESCQTSQLSVRMDQDQTAWGAYIDMKRGENVQKNNSAMQKVVASEAATMDP